MADTTITLPELPSTISRAQCIAALNALGFPHNARTLTMDAYGVTLTLLAQDPDGQFLHAGDDSVCITVHLPYAQQRADPPMTPEQFDTLTQRATDKLRQQPNHGRVG